MDIKFPVTRLNSTRLGSDRLHFYRPSSIGSLIRDFISGADGTLLECICEPMIASRAREGRGGDITFDEQPSNLPLVPILSKMKRSKKNKQGYEKEEEGGIFRNRREVVLFLRGSKVDRRRNEGAKKRNERNSFAFSTWKCIIIRFCLQRDRSIVNPFPSFPIVPIENYVAQIRERINASFLTRIVSITISFAKFELVVSYSLVKDTFDKPFVSPLFHPK